jgi:cytidine deaminase
MPGKAIPWSEMFDVAAEARRHAHAPYSGFAVGAAVYAEGGGIFFGCNVENSSYGLSVCAERNAIASAIANAGRRKLLGVAVVTSGPEPSPPCGACRQVMAEFGSADLPVRCRNLAGRERRFALGKLLPDAFSKRHLQLHRRARASGKA